jgi:agmatinase
MRALGAPQQRAASRWARGRRGSGSAFAPGTGTPEIGGLATWQAQAILRALGGIDFVGMDVMEVAPAYDHAEITALAAATIVWEYLALVGDPARVS